MKKNIKISVRDLVEFVLQTGDIISGFTGSSRNVDAIKAHQTIQNSYSEGYNAEVTVKHITEHEGIVIEVNGRIDGVMDKNGAVTIDEIKTTMRDLSDVKEDYNLLHWAQAKCYAYIYCVQNSYEKIGVQLTYYNLDTSEIKYFNQELTLNELENFYYDIIKKYIKWAKITYEFQQIRNDSILNIKFPHKEFRNGQRDLSVRVFRIAKDGGKLFAQAPTGTGKTVATLFPAIKALGEEHVSKIFYLTAKNITGTLAENTMDLMRKNGLRIKTITLTAKDKICFKDETNCNPDYCEFAKGHFDRVKNAIEDIYEEDLFSKEVIECYARKHKICPFEFALDLTLWSDCIIGDYNYVFDPRVYLKRFFLDNSGDFIFLVDEAHNLVDRSREMFSAELMKKDFYEIKKITKGIYQELYKSTDKINKFFIEEKKAIEGNYITTKEAPKEIYPLLRNFQTAAEKTLLKNTEITFKSELLDLYFAVLAFLRTSESYDERFVTYFEKLENDFKMKLFCLDPSYLLSECAKRGKAIVFFSATLSPMDYFIKILGGNLEDLVIKLKSPFPKENLLLMLNDNVSTKFSNREKSYEKVVMSIYTVICQKTGNYLVFFPSYKYLKEVHDSFNQIFPKINTIVQSSGMKEEAREEFLSEFKEKNAETLIGFAVMGGVFGEGIDLTGDKLSGAIIVGVGLPQICLERDIIREYFQIEKNEGFEYAYVYPGINKVMQAVGRVIRTHKDIGVVLLIDERFSKASYKKLLPNEWKPMYRIKNNTLAAEKIRDFWKEKNSCK